MEPIRFEDADIVYRGPTADIGDLWVRRIRPGHVEAVFELNDDERQLLAEGGRISIQILSEPMPPIGLNVVPVGAIGYEPVGEHPWKVIPELDDEERQRG